MKVSETKNSVLPRHNRRNSMHFIESILQQGIWLIIFGGVSKTKKSPSLTSMEMISSYSSRFIRFIYMLLLSSKYGISFELFVANCRWLQRQLYMKGRISQTSPGGINKYPEPRLLNCCCVN